MRARRARGTAAWPTRDGGEGGWGMSVLIKRGCVVTATDQGVADILVEDGVITRIGRDLEESADRVIDAGGMYVLPGGVDPHTHLEMPSGGTTTCDDFTS